MLIQYKTNIFYFQVTQEKSFHPVVGRLHLNLDDARSEENKLAMLSEKDEWYTSSPSARLTQANYRCSSCMQDHAI